jgi:predicted amidophosphoribosyltransferase
VSDFFRAIDFLRAWLFPPACVACDAPGPGLCAACAPGPGAALAFDIDGVPAFALGPYEGALRRAVVALKHGERDPLDALAALLERAPVDGVLVPVPTTRRRAAERGFDQSVQLARRLAVRRGLPCAELLAKHGRAQAGRGRGERLAARGRFGLRAAASGWFSPRVCADPSPGIALPREVTLLDDVCTTGATLRDALWTLREQAVEVRRIVVVARALDDRPRHGGELLGRVPRRPAAPPEPPPPGAGRRR